MPKANIFQGDRKGAPWLLIANRRTVQYLLLHANVATSNHAESLERSNDGDNVRIFQICASLYKSSSRLDNPGKSDYTKVTVVTETFMPLSDLKLRVTIQESWRTCQTRGKRMAQANTNHRICMFDEYQLQR